MPVIYDTDTGEIAARYRFDPYDFTLEDAAGPAVENALNAMFGDIQYNRTEATETAAFRESDGPAGNTPTSQETLQRPSNDFITDALSRRLRPGYLIMEPAAGETIAMLSTRYDATDPVSTPDGQGIVIEAVTDTVTVDGETVDGSEDSPAYVVALDSGGMGTFKASDLDADEWLPDEDVDPTTLDDEAEKAALEPLLEPRRFKAALEDPGVGFDRLPDGWDRTSVLKAWVDLGGSFTSAERELSGEVRDPSGLAAALKDEVLGTEEWRGKF